MAVDLRLEKFAIDTFLHLWEFCVPDKPPLMRPKDYGDESETDCTNAVMYLILSRSQLHRKSLCNLKEDYKLYSRNGVDFYYYLRTHMTKYIAYTELNAFDKLLISCAVVTRMGIYCIDNENTIYTYTGPLSWAMYFEMELKEEFYAAGGWMELQKYAETRCSLILYWYGMISVAEKTKTDLETAEELYSMSKQNYFLDDIFETFKQRVDGQYDRLSCSKCLPLWDVFYSLSFGRNDNVDDYKLVEGYVQIFLRMLTREDHDLCISIMDDSFSDMTGASKMDGNFSDMTEEEKLELSDTVFRTASTKKLYDRLFVTENWDSSERPNSNCNTKRCVFCGKGTENPTESFNREDDSERVEYLRKLIRKTVSDVEFTEETDSTSTKVAAGDERISDRTLETIVLRLFLALGMEPAFSKVKANIEKEFGAQCSLKNTTDSLDNLEIQDGKKIYSQKKNKKKKKKKN